MNTTTNNQAVSSFAPVAETTSQQTVQVTLTAADRVIANAKATAEGWRQGACSHLADRPMVLRR